VEYRVLGKAGLKVSRNTRCFAASPSAFADQSARVTPADRHRRLLIQLDALVSGVLTIGAALPFASPDLTGQCTVAAVEVGGVAEIRYSFPVEIL
jgi:hypothetical protein